MSDAAEQEPYPTGTVRRLLATDYVTAKTREVLLARLTASATHTPRFFDKETLATLAAACARLIPQAWRERLVDLAANIDDRLAEGKCDGWRYGDMPPDGEAYLLGMRGLDSSASEMFGAPFADLDGDRQDAILRLVQRGEVSGGPWVELPARRFFEEWLAELSECYYSDPISQEQIGYLGMADAHGWREIGLNRRERWETRMAEDEHD